MRKKRNVLCYADGGKVIKDHLVGKEIADDVIAKKKPLPKKELPPPKKGATPKKGG